MTRTRLALLATTASALGLAACVDNSADAPMLIMRNLAPQEGCALNADSDSSISSGRIQVNTPVGYLFTPLIRNDLTVVNGEATGPKTIFLEGAHVDIQMYDPDFFDAGTLVDLNGQDLLKFSTPVSGSIDPGGGSLSVAFEIVPHELIGYISDHLVNAGSSTVLDVRVQMYGVRGAGDIESNIFRFPVQVCRDCLVFNLGSCTALPQGVTPRTGGFCNPYQDQPLDCCTGAAGDVCPAAAPGGA